MRSIAPTREARPPGRLVRTDRPARRTWKAVARRTQPTESEPPRTPRRSGQGLDGRVVRSAPLLRFIHRDDRVAEMLGPDCRTVADDAHLPRVCARVFQQEAAGAVWKLPQSCQRNFTHGLATL